MSNRNTDKSYEVRFAQLFEFNSVHDFIKNQWDENYSFATNPEYMRYLHVKEEQLHFVVVEETESHEICGILGYMYYNEFIESDISAVLLKVKENIDKMLGVRMLIYLQQKLPQRSLSSCGIRKNTLNIYKFLKWKTAKFNYYYRLADLEYYHICKMNEKKIKKIEGGMTAQLIPISTYAQLQNVFTAKKCRDHLPYKDMPYLKWRYYEVPFYQYTVWGIEVEKKISSVLVGREISCQGGKMLTLVDFIGEDHDLGKIGMAVQALMDIHGYEYVEFMCYGIENSVLERGGFTRREDNDKNILPSHFEPFLCENIDKYLFSTKMEGIKMFRGDSNQDVIRYV